MRTSFAPCHESLEKNMFTATLRIYENDLEKISYKSYYEKPFSGYEKDVRPE